MRLFGTDGVRGIIGKDMNHEVAMRLGLAVGSHFKVGNTVAVGRDARASGPMLASAAVAGLLASGVNVVRLGICPTPAIQLYAAQHDEVDAALIITASHNPAEWNGIKFIAGDGTEASRQDEEHVEDLYFSQKFRTVDWRNVGKLTESHTARDEYLKAVLKRVDQAAIKKRKFRVVVDAAGGPGALTTPTLVKALGGTVIPLMCDLDPFLSGRKPEPVEDNLSLLKAKVAEEKADFGVAHDGDADRAVFVDDQGRFVTGDQSFALLAGHALSRNGKGGVICTPVSTSSMVEEFVKSHGGRVVYTAVGSPIVGRRMRTEKAVFGGEENGGLIFPEIQFCRDALMSTARMMELLASARKPLSGLRAELPKYSVTKTKIECANEKKPKLVVALKEWARKEHPTARIDETDGFKIYFDDGWVLARPSGTEPLFRVYAESKSEKRSKELADSFVSASKRLAAKV